MDGEGSTRLNEMVREAVRAEVGAAVEDLRRFIDRRIAELSTEINATVQIMDFSEANLTGQLNRIHEQVARVVALPAAATRNSGVELEAVVVATEEAANTIMEAAEAIGGWVATGAGDRKTMDRITEKVNAIFEACSFQDLTGQRIRRAIEHLQKVETMLEDMVKNRAAQPVAATIPDDAGTSPDLVQDDIDRLFRRA